MRAARTASTKAKPGDIRPFPACEGFGALSRSSLERHRLGFADRDRLSDFKIWWQKSDQTFKLTFTDNRTNASHEATGFTSIRGGGRHFDKTAECRSRSADHAFLVSARLDRGQSANQPPRWPKRHGTVAKAPTRPYSLSLLLSSPLYN